MLVVIEGLDGAGKSTQVSKLKKYLEQKLGKVNYLHFPRYDAPVYGALISNFLKGVYGNLESVHPQLVALLYAEDRKDAVPYMRGCLNKNEALLLDRYVYSNIAYQCAKQQTPQDIEALRQWIFDTEYNKFNLPKPDLNIFLDVPFNFVKSNLEYVRTGEDRTYLEGNKDIHEANINFQAKVRQMYLQQCLLDDKFIRVDCADNQGNMLPADAIFMKIKQIVDSVL